MNCNCGGGRPSLGSSSPRPVRRRRVGHRRLDVADEALVVDGKAGVDLDHGPASCDRVTDLVVPQLVSRSLRVEVPDVSGRRTLLVSSLDEVTVAAAEHFDNRARKTAELDRSKAPGEHAVQDGAHRRRLCECVEHGERRPSESPRLLDVGDAERVIKASLIVSFASSGRARRTARIGARVDFPLAGGPDTTTKDRGAAISQHSARGLAGHGPTPRHLGTARGAQVTPAA